MRDENQAKILEFVRSLDSANQSVDADTDLITTGSLDSLSVMELVAFLTDEFKIKIAAADITPVNLRSVATLTAFVEARSS
jgi:acyl carrier protein